jgi:hypothetical protein
MCFPPVLSHRKDAEDAEMSDSDNPDHPGILPKIFPDSIPKVLRFASSYDQEVHWAMFLTQRKKVSRNSPEPGFGTPFENS